MSHSAHPKLRTLIKFYGGPQIPTDIQIGCSKTEMTGHIYIYIYVCIYIYIHIYIYVYIYVCIYICIYTYIYIYIYTFLYIHIYTFFFCSVGVWTQVLTNARHLLPLSYTPSPIYWISILTEQSQTLVKKADQFAQGKNKALLPSGGGLAITARRTSQEEQADGSCTEATG
jgi:hypothetical protein